MFASSAKASSILRRCQSKLGGEDRYPEGNLGLLSVPQFTLQP